MKVLKRENGLSRVESGVICVKFAELIDDSHEITTLHKFSVHVDNPLVLADAVETQDERVVQLAHN